MKGYGLPLMAIAMAIVTPVNAQGDQAFTKAYICQAEGGPVLLVKDEDLPNIRDSQCRTIEYRQASDPRLRNCKLHNGGGAFTDQQFFKVEAGCRVIKEPLQ